MNTLLTKTEKNRGWVAFCCKQHGFLVATTPNAVVKCKCGRKGWPVTD